MPNPPVPQHCPSPRELDDLELLTTGALAPITSFNQPGSPITLDLPAAVAEQATAAGAVELVDPEGLPLAVVSVPGGAVEPLTHAQFGPFRSHYLTPAQSQEAYAGRTFVPVTDALTRAQLDELRGIGPAGPARAGRARHPRPLPRRPAPRHAGRGPAPAGRRRGRGAARLPRRRRGRPRPRPPGRHQLRRPQPRPRASGDARTATTPTTSPRSSTSTSRRPTARAWCCSSPASPAAASRRWPAR